MIDRVQLSDNFWLHEVACHGTGCCDGTSVVIPEMVDAMQEFADILGVPVPVECWYRCPEHNDRRGGGPSSQHPRGRAADIHWLPGVTHDAMIHTAKTVSGFHHGGIGIYDWGIHVDCRLGGAARWGDSSL